MEDSSLFMQWAMETLLDEHPEPDQPALDLVDVDDDCLGETTFPSLQALRDASHAAEMVEELLADEAHPANSWSSGDGGDTTIDNNGSNTVVPAAAPAAAASGRDDCYGSWPQSRSSSRRRAPPPSNSSAANLLAVSWNFVTGSAQPGSDDGVLEEATQPAPPPPSLPPEKVVVQPSPPTTRRASSKGLGAPSSASYTPDHIIAERKRREKINKRLIELSTVVPGLKKMDKATILSAAAKYVKELQQRIKALEDAAAAGRSNETTVVLVNKPCSAAAAAAAAPDENGSRSSSTSASSRAPSAAVRNDPAALPEIVACVSPDKTAMVRVHCRSGKGVAVAVIAEVEELGLTIVHANVMPSSACTMIISITAKVEGLTIAREEIVGRLSSALSHHHGSCNGTA